MTFEEKLKNEIEDQYGSVYHFSQVCGVSRPLFTKLFKNGIESISFPMIEKIAKALSLSPEGLREKRIEEVEIEKPEGLDEMDKAYIDSFKAVSPLEREALTYMRKLSTRGQFKAIEYMEDILPKYPKE